MTYGKPSDDPRLIHALDRQPQAVAGAAHTGGVAMIRAFAVGVGVGAAGFLFAILELVRRAATAEQRRYTAWPRQDGSDQGFGSVWDHGA